MPGMQLGQEQQRGSVSAPAAPATDAFDFSEDFFVDK
jgi:hypothetical protein